MVAGVSPGPALPRSLGVLGIPAAAVVLIALFLFRGFPYDVLGERITSELARADGVQVRFAELGPAFRLAGPGLEAHGVVIELPNGPTVAFDRVMARAAWSLSWLRLEPAVFLELASATGTAEGTLHLGSTPGWDGELADYDLAALPFEALVPGGHLEGKVDAVIDVRIGEAGPEGPIQLEAQQGSIALPVLPLALPFERLDATLTLGGDDYVALEALTLEGPLASGTGSGRIARGPSLSAAPLEMTFELRVQPALAGAVRAAGLRPKKNGATTVRLSGTLANPSVR